MAFVGFKIPGENVEFSEKKIVPLRTRNVAAAIKSSRSSGENSVIDHPYFVSNSFEESKHWYLSEVKNQIFRGGLFEDPFFPAKPSSIYPSAPSLGHTWLRPPEITRSPQFVADGISRFDVLQGELGDCWLLAAVACLSLHENLFREVVPPGQTFITSTDGRPTHRDGIAYVGMFWFRFWQFGKWIDVVIDDRLPTKQRNLVFMHSSDQKEFWSALLEKAYCKLVGSYEALRGGTTAEAMEDFTGGLTEVVELGEKTPANLPSIMLQLQNRSSLMACSIDASPEQQESEGPHGLILGHAYSVTDVKKVRDKRGEDITLIRLRNPWGNDREWRGPWSDKSREWNRISEAERTRIGLTFDNDGEFWMSFTDFDKYFSRLEMCHLSPEFSAQLTATLPKRRWEMTRHLGEWLRSSTAGGCRNFPETFHMNPQFHIDVEDPDETDNDPTGTIVIGLMQMGMREKRQQPHTIGYAIYKFPRGAPKEALLTRKFFLTTSSTARSPVFTNMREVCGRHKLAPGTYAIIPSTYEPDEEAKFLLRIFSEKAYTAGELDEPFNIGSNALDVPINALKDGDHFKELRSAFDAIAGKSGALESEELRDILNAIFTNKGFNFDGFSRETARSMVALLDIDTSGTLGFDEFKKLWHELRLWQTVYKRFDPNGSGDLNARDLREVLSQTGIRVSNDIFKAIVCRYVNKGKLSFDDYILLVVRLITVFEKFKERKCLGSETVTFTTDETPGSLGLPITGRPKRSVYKGKRFQSAPVHSY